MPIEPRHEALWRRIVAHRFDDPAARLTFTRRLARENGWTICRAIRVVDEYRRFAFLAVTAGHPVTPSEDVDQAWHLHLAHTRDYWGSWCGQVLGVQLHHGPTRGGDAEAHRYDHQYRRTLVTYSVVFDAAVPDDIWPTAERRFGADLAWQRVNVERNWVIPKPVWLPRRARSSAGLAVFAAMPFVVAAVPNPLDWTAPPFLMLFAALATGAVVAGLLLRQALSPAGDPMAITADIEPLELALLANDGRMRFAAAGIAMLTPCSSEQSTGIPEAKPPTLPIAPEPPPGSTPLLASLHRLLAALGTCLPGDAMKAAVEMAEEEVEPSLVARGLLVGPWWSTFAPWIILAPAMGTVALGIAKVCVGVSRGKPVGILVVGCIALAIVSVVAIARKPRRTRQGDVVVRAAWKRFRESGQQKAWSKRQQVEVILPVAVALLGTAALVNTGHAALLAAVQRLESGGSAGGGCGTDGGCGGGGCGGCGGGGD
jgi:uncharacterized protein (TIGR04222 family)